MLDYVKAHLTDPRVSHILSTFFVLGAMVAPDHDKVYIIMGAAVLAAFGYRPPKSIQAKVDAMIDDGDTAAPPGKKP